MKKIKELNLLDNKKLALKLNIWAIILMFFFYVVFFVIATTIRPPLDSNSSGLMHLFTNLAIYFALIVIHELIHGIFFKLFQPKQKVLFGFKNFMAYASSPGSKYSAREYSIICLAPFILITIGLTLFYALSSMANFDYVLLVSLHAGSCIGDFYFFKLILQSPKGAKFEDTATGFNVYQ